MKHQNYINSHTNNQETRVKVDFILLRMSNDYLSTFEYRIIGKYTILKQIKYMLNHQEYKIKIKKSSGQTRSWDIKMLQIQSSCFLKR